MRALRLRPRLAPSRWAPLALAALLAAGAGGTLTAQGQDPGAARVVIALESGQSIVIELAAGDAPETVANFLTLVEDRFYDGLVFHRVEDWVVQTGCPQGDGTGGPPWSITLEPTTQPNLRGAVGMARSGEDPHSAGSQFYILKKDATHLDGSYAVFGKVTSGMDAVDSLQQGAVVASIRVEGTAPDEQASEEPPVTPAAVETSEDEGTNTMPIDESLLAEAALVPLADLAEQPANVLNPGVRLTLEGGGVIIFELRTAEAPLTCAHFAGIVASGFLDGVYFHRSDAMCIQGGDGASRGGERWPDTVDLEVSGLPFGPGSVGMARTQDPNSATSQFFLCKAQARHLDGGYANFGQVLLGMDVVLAMPTRELGDPTAPLSEDYRVRKAELVRFAP